MKNCLISFNISNLKYLHERRNLTIKTTSQGNQSPCCWISIANKIFNMKFFKHSQVRRVFPIFHFLLN